MTRQGKVLAWEVGTADTILAFGPNCPEFRPQPRRFFSETIPYVAVLIGSALLSVNGLCKA